MPDDTFEDTWPAGWSDALEWLEEQQMLGRVEVVMAYEESGRRIQERSSSVPTKEEK